MIKCEEVPRHVFKALLSEFGAKAMHEVEKKNLVTWETRGRAGFVSINRKDRKAYYQSCVRGTTTLSKRVYIGLAANRRFEYRKYIFLDMLRRHLEDFGTIITTAYAQSMMHDRDEALRDASIIFMNEIARGV